MHFKYYEPVEYEHNILFHVVFQARFPEIMRIQHEPPIAFQDAIRKEGYTEINQSMLPTLPGIIPDQALDRGRTFHFLREEKDWEVTLGQGFVSLNCHRNYTNYSEFSEKLTKALQIFHGIYRPPYYTRIGLMYRNMANKVFLPHQQQMNILSFIPEHIFPVLTTDMEKDILNLQMVSQFGDKEIKATATHTLSQISGVFGHRRVTNEQSYVIEIDCFYERNVGVINEILAKCNTFKEIERNIFEWSITNALREAMGKSES